MTVLNQRDSSTKRSITRSSWLHISFLVTSHATITPSTSSKKMKYKTSCFSRDLVETFAILERYPAWAGNWIPTSRDNPSVPPTRVKRSKKTVCTVCLPNINVHRVASQKSEGLTDMSYLGIQYSGLLAVHLNYEFGFHVSFPENQTDTKVSTHTAQVLGQTTMGRFTDHTRFWTTRSEQNFSYSTVYGLSLKSATTERM